MKTIIIAGGTGFLGTVLINYFKDKANHIYILSRSKKENYDNVSFLIWDGKTKGAWASTLESADVLINMTGKSVDCRYNQQNKDLILSSRIDATKVLGEVIQDCINPPKVWLNSSTATIYRHSLNKEMSEDTGELGGGFSVGIAKAWEQEFFSFENSSTRQIALRTSIVFGKKGGALIPIKNLARIGFGGTQGPGNQKVSWIHEKDFARSIEFIIKNKHINGAINIVSPKPTKNKNLMKAIRKIIGIPFGIPMGRSILEFGAKIIKTETELILKSRNVVPKKLLDNGFTFQYGSLSSCLKNLLN